MANTELLLDTSATTSFTDQMSSATGLNNLQLVTSLSRDGKHQNAAGISNSANDDILVASSSGGDVTGSFKASSALGTLTLQSSASGSSSGGGAMTSLASNTDLMSSANMGEGNMSNMKMKWAYSSFVVASLILGCI
jgi:hypothetical protein